MLQKEDEACAKYSSLLQAWSNNSETGINYPDFYGGAYINNDKNLVIQVTSIADEIINYFGSIINLNNVIFNEVEYPYSTLKAQYDTIVNNVVKSNNFPLVTGVSIIEKDNSINIYISNDSTTAIMPLSLESLDDYIIIDNVNLITNSAIDPCSTVELGSKIFFLMVQVIVVLDSGQRTHLEIMAL